MSSSLRMLTYNTQLRSWAMQVGASPGYTLPPIDKRLDGLPLPLPEGHVGSPDQGSQGLLGGIGPDRLAHLSTTVCRLADSQRQPSGSTPPGMSASGS